MSDNLSDNPGSLGLLVKCKNVSIDILSSWNEIHDVFSKIKGIPLRQTWLKKSHNKLEKGIIKLACNSGHLLVYADFDDSYIYNPATKFNDPVRPQGDFLEMILRPDLQDAYYELHVTPQNLQSQFCFEQAECAKKIIDANPGKTATELFAVDFPIFESKTELNKNINKWYGMAHINLKNIVENDHQDKVKRLFYNCCRKNLTKSGESESSSTAELSEYNYHHQNEWGTILLS